MYVHCILAPSARSTETISAALNATTLGEEKSEHRLESWSLFSSHPSVLCPLSPLSGPPTLSTDIPSQHDEDAFNPWPCTFTINQWHMKWTGRHGSSLEADQRSCLANTKGIRQYSPTSVTMYRQGMRRYLPYLLRRPDLAMHNATVPILPRHLFRLPPLNPILDRAEKIR